jgi:hypothetical protein
MVRVDFALRRLIVFAGLVSVLFALVPARGNTTFPHVVVTPEPVIVDNPTLYQLVGLTFGDLSELNDGINGAIAQRILVDHSVTVNTAGHDFTITAYSLEFHGVDAMLHVNTHGTSGHRLAITNSDLCGNHNNAQNPILDGTEGGNALVAVNHVLYDEAAIKGALQRARRSFLNSLANSTSASTINQAERDRRADQQMAVDQAEIRASPRTALNTFFIDFDGRAGIAVPGTPAKATSDSTGKIVAYSYCTPGQQFPDGRYELETADDAANLQSSAFVTWELTNLRATKGEALDAERRGQTQVLFSLFRNYQSLPDYAPAEANDAYLQVVNDLNDIRRRTLLPISERNMYLVGPSGFSEPCSLIYEMDANGLPQGPYLVANKLLVVPTTLSGTRYDGILYQNVVGDDLRLRLHFTARLAFDAYFRHQLAAQLHANGESIAGDFTDWSLSSGSISGEGIADGTFSSVGNVVSGDITFARDATQLALAEAFTPYGLPIQLTWIYAKDHRFTGTLPLHLSFSQVDDPLVTIDKSGRVHNSEVRDVWLQYVSVGGEPRLITPPLLVKANGDAALDSALPASVIASGISLATPDPAAGLHGINNIFDVVQDGTLFTSLYVVNTLSGRIAGDNHGDFLSVDLTIETPDGRRIDLSLLPSGTYNSDVSVPVVQPPPGHMFKVAGVAHFSSGPWPLRPFATDTLLISINASTLQ